MKIRAFIQLVLCLSLSLCTVNLSAQIHVDSDKDVVVGTPANNDPDAKVIVKTNDDDLLGIEVSHKANIDGKKIGINQFVDDKGVGEKLGINNIIYQDVNSSHKSTGMVNYVKGSDGAAAGVNNNVNTGTGFKRGLQNAVTQGAGSTKAAYGVDNIVAGAPSAAQAATGPCYGMRNIVRWGSGNKSGILNQVTQLLSGGVANGVENLIQGGSGVASGMKNVVQFGDGVKRGIENSVKQTVTSGAAAYGVLNNIKGGTGILVGMRNTLTLGTGQKRGIENNITQTITSSQQAFGMDNKVKGGTGTTYGVKNDVSTGTGEKRGIENKVVQDVNSSKITLGVENIVEGGTTTAYGIRNKLNKGTGLKYGISNNVFQESGSNFQVEGIRNIYNNLGSSWSYGLFQRCEDTNIENRTHGIHNIIHQAGSPNPHGAQINGIFNHIIGNSASSPHMVTGINSVISQHGDAPKYGIKSSVKADSISASTHKAYGVHSEAFSYHGSSDIYGVKSVAEVNNNGMGYGIHATVVGNGYAGYFDGNSQFNGDVTVTGTFNNPSDSRLKKNIIDLSQGLSLLSQLRPVSYYYDEKVFASASKERQYGFIAQEVEKVLPDLVNEIDLPDAILKENSSYKNAYSSSEVKAVRVNSVQNQESATKLKGMNYIAIIPILVDAIQELEDMTREQQKEIEQLKEKMKSLNSNK